MLTIYYSKKIPIIVQALYSYHDQPYEIRLAQRIKSIVFSLIIFCFVKGIYTFFVFYYILALVFSII
jgi:hypothetical protein